MKRFEYKIFDAGDYTDSQFSEERLNELGSEGWELCGVGITISYSGAVENTFYFKKDLGVLMPTSGLPFSVQRREPDKEGS